MASGLPDYEKMVRPKYGGCNLGGFTVAVAANTTTTLISISGKGMIYTSGLIANKGATSKADAGVLEIDGVVVQNSSFSILNQMGLWLEHGAIMPLCRYDDVDFLYVVGIIYGITFETSLVLKYIETYGDTPVVTGAVYYALV